MSMPVKKVLSKKPKVVLATTSPRVVLPRIGYQLSGLHLGCDPEAFFVKDGKVVGSEKIIKKDGIISANGYGKIIRDGVQLEFNPTADICRERLRGHFITQFREIKNLLDSPAYDGVTVSSEQTVTLSQEEMDSLSPESKQFGCTPSYNVYDENIGVGVDDASKFFSRSAGGHIHLGAATGTNLHKVLQDAKRLIPVMDLIVGNTCVMIDRDKGNITRRQTYGRAGEFRLPKHGIEYRTLSNFWLREYTLMSFVMGLSRQAVSIVYNSSTTYDYAGELMSLVNIEDVRNAINNNDKELALMNFNKIKEFLVMIGMDNRDDYVFDTISLMTMPSLEYFLSKDVDYWFPSKDIIGNWMRLYTSPFTSGETNVGIEKFLTGRVAKELTAEMKKVKS